MTARKTPPPKITLSPAAEAAESVKEGRFAKLEREAVADYVPADPYVLDEFTPPIVITAPVEVERVIAFAMLGGVTTRVTPDQFEPLLRAVCGDAYDRVWTELLRGKHFNVTSAFLSDVQSHFKPKAPKSDNGAGEVPGGSTAS